MTKLDLALERVANLRAGRPKPIFEDHFYLLTLADEIERLQKQFNAFIALAGSQRLGGTPLQRPEDEPEKQP